MTYLFATKKSEEEKGYAEILCNDSGSCFSFYFMVVGKYLLGAVRILFEMRFESDFMVFLIWEEDGEMR